MLEYKKNSQKKIGASLCLSMVLLELYLKKKNHPKLKLSGLQLNSFFVNIKLSTLEI